MVFFSVGGSEPAVAQDPPRVVLQHLIFFVGSDFKVGLRVWGRVANCAHWFLKLPHSEAKEQMISNVNILGGSSSVLELLETIGNSARRVGIGSSALFRNIF